MSIQNNEAPSSSSLSTIDQKNNQQQQQPQLSDRQMTEVSISSSNNQNHHLLHDENQEHTSTQQQQQDEKLFQSLSSKGFVNTYRPLEFIIGIVLTLTGFLIGSKVIPHCRPFLWTDASISNAYHENTFPDYSLVIMCLITVVFMAIIVLVIGPQFDGSKILLSKSTSSSSSLSPTALRGAEVVCVVLYFLHALTLNEFITGPLKVYDGRLRPDFLSRLQSLGYSAANTTVDWCELTKTESLIHKGRLSFPSGHSSTSFFCCTALTLYLVSRLRAFSVTNGLTNNNLLAKRLPFLRNGIVRLLIGSLPMILCFIIAASRTRDNRHHFADILAGSIIGFFSAIVSWKLHFVHVDEAKVARWLALMDARGGKNSKKEDDDTMNDDSEHSSTQHVMPWFLRDEYRDTVGDHVPRWFVGGV